MKEKKHLLILGGGALNIAAIKEAKANGFITYVADGNAGAPGFAVADVPVHANITSADEVFEKIKQFSIDGIVAMAEVGVIPGASLNEKLHTGGITPATAAFATSKAFMRQRWANNGYSVQFRIVKTYDEAVTAVEELNYFPLILKPDRTNGGSRGVSKINSQDELAGAFEFARVNGMNDLTVIEHCTTGEEFSCEVLAYNGKAHLLCIGQKIKSPLPYRVDCSVQYPAQIGDKDLLKVKDMVQHAVQDLQLANGVAHIEFALTLDGPRLFELGARCGGGHTPLIAKHVSGVNEFIEYAHIACGVEPQIKPLEKGRGADYRFIIFEPGEVKEIMVGEEVKKHPGVYDLVITVKPGDTIEELKTTSQRSGAVVTFAETFEQATSLADFVCKNIFITYTDGTRKTALIYK